MAKAAGTEDTEELKSKIQNMASIIEELSSTPGGDSEEIIDSKLH